MEALLAADRPQAGLTQAELAERLGVAAPTVSLQVRSMKAEALLDRPPRIGLHQRGLPVRAPRLFAGMLIDRDRGILDEWRAPVPAERADQVPIDLRFPYATRVPDRQARMFLHEWLDRAHARDLLAPHQSIFEPRKDLDRHEMIGVFGSCARGEADLKSDLDILLYTDRTGKQIDGLIDLAHDVVVQSKYAEEFRPLDIHTIEPGRPISQLTPDLRARLASEVKTIHTNDQTKPFLEQLVRGETG